MERNTPVKSIAVATSSRAELDRIDILLSRTPTCERTSLNGDSQCSNTGSTSAPDRHFDKDKAGRLNHKEFKSCLRALGYDLPMVEEGQPDPEFNEILGKLLVSCLTEMIWPDAPELVYPGLVYDII